LGGAIPVNLFVEAVFSNRLFDVVYLAAENFGLAVFEIIQAADGVETRGREIPSQAHHHVDIMRGVFATGDRPEQRRAHYASCAEPLFVRFQGVNDLVAVHGFILPYPFAQSRP